LNHRNIGGAGCGTILIDHAYTCCATNRCLMEIFATKLKNGRLVRELMAVVGLFAVELSIFHSRDGDAGGSSGWQRGGAEAFGINLPRGVGTEILLHAAACADIFSGCGG